MGITVLFPVHVSVGLPCLEAESITMLQHLLHATPAPGPCSTDPIMALLLAVGVMRYTAAYAALLFIKL